MNAAKLKGPDAEPVQHGHQEYFLVVFDTRTLDTTITVFSATLPYAENLDGIESEPPALVADSLFQEMHLLNPCLVLVAVVAAPMIDLVAGLVPRIANLSLHSQPEE